MSILLFYSLLLIFIFRSTDSDHSKYLLSTEKEQEIPEDLICGICRNIFVDAVMIPCCGSSFCDDCKYKKCNIRNIYYYFKIIKRFLFYIASLVV